MNDLNKMEELFSALREIAFNNSPTKNDKVPKEQDLSKSDVDNIFDVDIFLSRKPGMRRSVQLISSDSKNKDSVRISCMTALASLCDTMVSNNLLSEKDIILFMSMWLDMHHISVMDLRS